MSDPASDKILNTLSFRAVAFLRPKKKETAASKHPNRI